LDARSRTQPFDPQAPLYLVGLSALAPHTCLYGSNNLVYRSNDFRRKWIINGVVIGLNTEQSYLAAQLADEKLGQETGGQRMRRSAESIRLLPRQPAYHACLLTHLSCVNKDYHVGLEAAQGSHVVFRHRTGVDYQHTFVARQCCLQSTGNGQPGRIVAAQFVAYAYHGNARSRTMGFICPDRPAQCGLPGRL
jgi:hypothetical protein